MRAPARDALHFARGRASQRDAATAPLTFPDVAPVFYNRCGSCHRPGGIGPFRSLSHADIVQRLPQIRTAVQERSMPPWKPDPGHGDFADERRLSESQKRQVLQWIDQGALQGDPGRVPPVPRFTDGWQLGEPDLVVSMPEAFEIPASGPDIFRNFVPCRSRTTGDGMCGRGSFDRAAGARFTTPLSASIGRQRRASSTYAMPRRDTKASYRFRSRTRTVTSSGGRLDRGNRSGPCRGCRGRYSRRAT